MDTLGLISHILNIHNRRDGLIELSLNLNMTISSADLMAIAGEMERCSQEMYKHPDYHPAVIFSALFGSDAEKMQKLKSQLMVAALQGQYFLELEPEKGDSAD